jgi:hypothetical protein
MMQAPLNAICGSQWILPLNAIETAETQRGNSTRVEMDPRGESWDPLASAPSEAWCF